MVKNLPAMQETRVQYLGGEDLLEKELAIHSMDLRNPLENPKKEETGGLQTMGSQRVRYN